MKLTHSTDLALRALMFLGLRGRERCTLEETANGLAVSENHLVKVVIRLSDGGYVRTVRGRGGGIELARAPQAIVIGDVIRQMEPDFNLVECLQQGPHACVLSPACELQPLLNKAMGAFLEVLDSKTLADLLVRRRRLQAVLAA
ncbi:MAG: Rrf2 family transcriptional regulator [Bdellovibrionales bacterium]|nr:Rrf2 family transcriptional regulator [Bdellovibrionales bacterium]